MPFIARALLFIGWPWPGGRDMPSMIAFVRTRHFASSRTHSQGTARMYLVLKLVHITAVILFLGNIITGLFWHAHAARTGDPRLLHHVMDGIIRSDRWFTLPGVVIIVVTGVLNALHAQLPLLGTPWIAWSLALLSVSGIVYGARVAPLQQQMRTLARVGVQSGEFDARGYHALARRWEWWGAAALLTPLAVLILMVLKPGS